MAGALGENYKVQVAVSGVLTDVGCQGDLTFNTGKTLEVSRTKNCKHPFFREAGYTAQFTVELETPMHATHNEILEAADDESLINVAVVSSDTGTPKWAGDAYVAYDPMTAPTEGITTIQVTVAWVNDPVRTTN